MIMSGACAKAAQLLSLREKEILQLLAEGDNTKQIADKLKISIRPWRRTSKNNEQA